MIAVTSPASTATHSASAAMPPLPGAHQIFSTRGLSLSFHTSACSRPPPPSTRIFIRHPHERLFGTIDAPFWGVNRRVAAGVEVRLHVLVLAATHPDLEMPADVERFVKEVQRKTPEAAWKQLASTNRKAEDAWDAQIREVRDPEQLQQEMDSLSQRFSEQKKNS